MPSSVDFDDDNKISDLSLLADQSLQKPIQAPSSKGISAASSIEAASTKFLPQQKPVLEPPRKKENVMYSIIRAHQQTEELTGKAADLFEEEMLESKKELDRLSLEKQKALQEQAEAARQKDTWETFSQVAQYVAGVTAIFAGTALTGLPYYLLVGAGVVGIGNRVIQDTNLLQAAISWFVKSEELKRTLAQKIETGLFFLHMGLGMASGYAAWQTGAFAATQAISALDLTRSAAGIISAVSTVMSAGLKVHNTFYQKQISDHQAKITQLNYYQTEQSHLMEQESRQITNTLEADQQQVEEIRKMVRSQQLEIESF